MAAENSRFANVTDDEILQIQVNAIPENTKKATKYGLRVFQGKKRFNIQTIQTKTIMFTIFQTNKCCSLKSRRQINDNVYVLLIYRMVCTTARISSRNSRHE